MVPFWVPIIIRHLIFLGYPTRDHSFDNHPSGSSHRHLQSFMLSRNPLVFLAQAQEGSDDESRPGDFLPKGFGFRVRGLGLLGTGIRV